MRALLEFQGRLSIKAGFRRNFGTARSWLLRWKTFELVPDLKSMWIVIWGWREGREHVLVFADDFVRQAYTWRRGSGRRGEDEFASAGV